MQGFQKPLPDHGVYTRPNDDLKFFDEQRCFAARLCRSGINDAAYPFQ